MNNLPNNGSIVILDDEYMEVEPLIKLLSKKCSHNFDLLLHITQTIIQLQKI